jgi:hypothetical protein
MEEQGPTSGPDQPLIGCKPEPGELAWCILGAPLDHPIYRDHQPHGPTPLIHLLGFQAIDTDRVPPLPNSTTDHRPRPLAIDAEPSRTSIITDLGHQIRVLHAANSAWSRPIGNLRPQIHWAPPLCRQAAHSTMSPQIHRATLSPPPRLMSSMGGPTPWDVQPRGLDLCHAHHLQGRCHCWEGRLCKTHSPMRCIHTALSASMDPLHRRRPLTAMLIHPCSHT